MSDVRFIRVHGRVVPIHDKGHSARDVAGGIAVAGAAGIAAASLHRDAATHLNRSKVLVAAKRTLSKKSVNGKFKAHIMGVEAAKNRLEGIRLTKAGNRIRAGGSAVSALLIGAGVHESLKNTDLTETEKSLVTGAATMGTHKYISSFLVRSSYLGKIADKKYSSKVFSLLKHAAKRVAARGHKL